MWECFSLLLADAENKTGAHAATNTSLMFPPFTRRRVSTADAVGWVMGRHGLVFRINYFE